MSEDARGREWVWAAGAALAAAVYALVVELLPARGLTFLWDDWHLLARIAHEPWPRRWLRPVNEHVKPIYVALFETEHALFGGDHTLFLVVSYLIHVVNVALLARLLAKRSGDARAGAVGALAFGLCASYREVLWWAGLSGLALSFTFVLVGLLAFEQARASERRAPLAIAAVATLAAPLAFGSGLALGPMLAVEAWALAPRERRARLALAVLAPWALAVALYAVISLGGSATHIAESFSLTRACDFAVSSIGLGVVGRTIIIRYEDHPGREPLFAFGLALAYTTVVSILTWALDATARTRLLLAQVWLALVVFPLAIARSSDPLHGAWSRYLYYPVLAWTPLVALGFAAAARRWPRASLAMTAFLLTVFAFGHAREAARDGRPVSPAARARYPSLVQRLVAAASAARGPVYDARLTPLLAFPPTRARDVVELSSPGVSIAWTDSLTPASIAPFAHDEALQEILDPRLRASLNR